MAPKAKAKPVNTKFRRRQTAPTAPKVSRRAAERLKTAKMSKSRLKAGATPLSVENLIASQMAGRDEYDNCEVRPYIVKVSDIIRGAALPSEPSDDVIRAIAHLVRLGNFPEVAARAVGIRSYLFHEWIAAGVKDPTSQYGKLLAAVDLADAQDEVTDLQLITTGVKHWNSLAWKRERKTAKRWKAKFEATIRGVDERPATAPQYEHVPDADTAASILETLEELGALSHVMPNNQPTEPEDTDDDDDDE